MRRPLAIATAVFGMIALHAGDVPATAAVVSGSNLSQAPNAGVCTSTAQQADCLVAVSSLFGANRAPGGARVAIDGVIVGWSVRSMASAVTIPMRLRVIRGIVAAGAGPPEILPTEAGIHSFAARVPVRAGDQLGVQLVVPPLFHSAPVARTTFDATFDFWETPPADGETSAPTLTGAPNEVLINATIEPDVDLDGFGDETQDCSSAPGPGVCEKEEGEDPAPPGRAGGPLAPALSSAPETRITRGPRGTISSSRASFRFASNLAGVRFQCKLDKKSFKACLSRKVLRGLGSGRHVFRVRAIGPTGLVDPTPAHRAFKVER